MKLLELFAGTQSVGKVARELGLEVVSLDRDMPADIQGDIMDWDYTTLPKKTFDIIWASPPCTEYSRAKTVGVRDLEGANLIVQRTLDIIEYFEPRYWMIENPQTGLLKDQLCMYGLPFVDVDYCKYGMFYRKRTRIWNNVFQWVAEPLCCKDCWAMNACGTRHREVAQRGPSKGYTVEERREQRRFKQAELYVVPDPLIRQLLNAILN